MEPNPAEPIVDTITDKFKKDSKLEGNTSCTEVAMHIFNKLTDDNIAKMTKAKLSKKTLSEADCPEMIEGQPSIVYVSLTGTEDERFLFDKSMGHRFVILLAGGYARILQAINNGRSSGGLAMETLSLKAFLDSNHEYSTKMEYEKFKTWWEDFKKMMGWSTTNRSADNVRDLLGVGYDGKANQSWFAVHKINEKFYQ